MKKLLAGILASLALFSAAAAPEVTLSGGGQGATPYKTIQAALDAIGAKEGDFTISLPKGMYEEVLYYKGPAHITLSGQTAEKYGADVVIAKDNNGDLLRLTQAGSAQRNRCLFEFEGTGSLTLENLTLHNTFVRGTVKGSNGQAETIGFDSTGNLAAYNCAFKSHQDTLRTTGKAWFYQCYVEGDTDFIWMEATGKVALFEECEIVSVYDEHASSHVSYIGAPRMDIGNTAAKGLVIYNSAVSSQPNQTTYLARTPWTSGYYNQVAFVATKASGIHADLWSGKPLMADGIPQSVIGWKIDSETAKSLGVQTKGRNDVMSDADAAKEYNGRRAILNRVYDLSSLRFKKDAEGFWDVDALIAARGWKVSDDKSKALLDGESETTRTVYTLDGSQQYADLTCNGFAQESGKAHFVGDAGATISFPVAGKSLVRVEGYDVGSGTIAAGKQGAAFYDFNNGSTAKFVEKAYVVYQGATTVTITATERSYITRITVEGDNGLSFIPVKKITISAADGAKELYGRKKLQFTATLNPAKPTNGDYVWSVSDPNAATISPSGLLTAANVAKDTTITVTATSCDAKRKSGKLKVKILKAEAGAFAVTWLSSPETSESLEGTSDNADVAEAGTAQPSAGTWKFNSSKITADIAGGAISYSGYSDPIAGKDKVYVDFPITAKQDLSITKIEAAFGNHGTGNVAALITATVGSRTETLATDESRTIRSVKKTFALEKPFAVKKGETATIRVALYGYEGSESQIATGKAPTIATITISGTQQ